MPGYIVLHNHDTLRGYIKDQPQSKEHLFCLFRATPREDALKYYPKDIKAYRYENGRAFESHIFKNEEDETDIQLFYELLFSGEKNLYMLRYAKNTYFFLESDDDLVNLKPKKPASHETGARAFSLDRRFKGTLHYLLSDAPQIGPLLDKAKLQENSLIEIAKAYHQAINPKPEHFEIPYYRDGLGLEIMPVFGYTYSWTSDPHRITKNVSRINMLQNFHPQMGIRFDLVLPKTRTKFFTGFQYEPFTGSTIMVEESFGYEKHVFIDYSMISASLGLSFPVSELFYPSFIYTGIRFGHMLDYRLMHFPRSPDEIMLLNYNSRIIDKTLSKMNLGIIAGYQYHKQFTTHFGMRLGFEAGFTGFKFGDEFRYILSTGLNIGLVFNSL